MIRTSKLERKDHTKRSRSSDYRVGIQYTFSYSASTVLVESDDSIVLLDFRDLIKSAKSEENRFVVREPLTHRRLRQSSRRSLDAYNEHVILVQKFNALATQWKKETNHMSLVDAIVLHPAYQQIIGMGYSVVPLILEQLKKQPDHWFWALRSITGENPIKPEDRGRMKKMAQAWLDWGKQHGYGS